MLTYFSPRTAVSTLHYYELRWARNVEFFYKTCNSYKKFSRKTYAKDTSSDILK